MYTHPHTYIDAETFGERLQDKERGSDTFACLSVEVDMHVCFCERKRDVWTKRARKRAKARKTLQSEIA